MNQTRPDALGENYLVLSEAERVENYYAMNGVRRLTPHQRRRVAHKRNRSLRAAK